MGHGRAKNGKVNEAGFWTEWLSLLRHTFCALRDCALLQDVAHGAYPFSEYVVFGLSGCLDCVRRSYAVGGVAKHGRSLPDEKVGRSIQTG